MDGYDDVHRTLHSGSGPVTTYYPDGGLKPFFFLFSKGVLLIGWTDRILVGRRLCDVPELRVLPRKTEYYWATIGF